MTSSPAEVSPPEDRAARPHPWDGFLTGPENELAFAGAQAMARGEREGLSPLVVHGPSGVGKSRLLGGLVVEWLRRHPASAVAQIDANSFVELCREAASRTEHRDDSTGWTELRGRFRSVDLFVMDDLEGLERAPQAREEFSHTLDAIEARGGAVAVACRTPPGLWPREVWPTRLASRLTGGLTARIDPPGLASRRRYILDHARAGGLVLSAEAIESLAETADGYRTLDGWLARLALDVRTTPSGGGKPGDPFATVELQKVAEALQDETDEIGGGPSIEQIAKEAAARFGVRLSALRGNGRQAAVVEARHLAMHAARLYTSLSFAAIGKYFGNRDPATVRHACKAAAARIEANPALAATLAALAHGK
jgi:chromosomal replication initiator protein